MKKLLKAIAAAIAGLSLCGLLVAPALGTTAHQRILLFGGGNHSAVVAQASLYVGQVATRSKIPNAASAVNKQLMSRSFHVARDNLSSIKIGLPAWEWGNNFADTSEHAAGGAITYTASIEYPAGTFSQVKCGGSASCVVADGSTLISDSTSVSIPNGSQFWVRIYGVAATAIVYTGSQATTPISPQCNSANGEAMTFAASGVVDQTMSGTVVATTAGDQGPILSPVLIIGQTRNPSVLLVGDSRYFGAGDSFDASGDLGEGARSIGAAFGYINTGSYGDTTAAYIAGHGQRALLGRYVSHVLIETGINDLTGTGSTAATVLANRQTIIGYFPGLTIFQQTVAPRSTSSDSWATTGNQTADTHVAQYAAFNDAIRLVPANTAGVFDITLAVENTIDSSVWKANGVAFKYTVDGVHESQFGYLAIQNSGAINTALIIRPVGDAPQTTAFLARANAVTTLDATHTAAYKGLINGGVADGWWIKLDVLFIYATQSSGVGLLNLTTATYTATNSGTTFVADRGFKNTSSSGEVDTTFNPFSASLANYTQNSAHVSAWSLNTGQNVVSLATLNLALTTLYPLFSDGNAYLRLNDNPNSSGFANSTTAGLFFANRDGPTTRQAYLNGSVLGTYGSVTTGALTSNVLVSVGASGTSNTNSAAAISAGGSFTPSDVTNFYNRMRTYMTAVGVP